MKVFLENYNGVLDTVMDALYDSGELTDNPHEADVFLLWQDVRGVPYELANIARRGKIPIVVMQHGRGAVRDYGPPNNFPFLADKILVWGERERQRLLGYSVGSDKIAIVGCPLLQRLKARNIERQGKNVLYVPIIAQKEEPENILVYAALKKWECDKLIENIYANFQGMKRAWAWQNEELKEFVLPDGSKERRHWNTEIKNNLPRWVTYGKGLLNVKLSGVHDQYQYAAPLIMSGQNDPNLIDGLVDLLANIDAMVCLEEGTMQLMAHAMGIPVVVADIFSYGNYGGCPDYDKIEKIRTNACYWTNKIEKIGGLLDHALAHPTELAKNRREVCEQEGGINWGDSVANVIGILKTTASRSETAVA